MPCCRWILDGMTKLLQQSVGMDPGRVLTQARFQRQCRLRARPLPCAVLDRCQGTALHSCNPADEKHAGERAVPRSSHNVAAPGRANADGYPAIGAWRFHTFAE